MVSVSYRLDRVRALAGRRIAALAQVTVTGATCSDGLSASGGKRPVAILIATGASVQAVGLDGTAIPLEDVEALCPGACAAVLAPGTGPER